MALVPCLWIPTSAAVPAHRRKVSVGFRSKQHCMSRLEQEKVAAASQQGALQGQWKARLSKVEAAHAEELHALQRRTREALKDARGQADDDLAAAHQ